jgi:hypothetical protein
MSGRLDEGASNNFEYPLPKLSVDIEALDIETKSSHSGNFSIKNAGGGVLKGKIISRCEGLFFEPNEFEGAAKINFSFNAATAGMGIGEAIRSKFFVTSNGGEKEIPVSAKLTKMSISTPDGYTIANIQDFYEYSLTHAAQARRIFTDSEFYMLLMASGYEYMEVYESLHKDANRERAMDNFFILSGLKGRTTLEVIPTTSGFGGKFPAGEYSASDDRRDFPAEVCLEFSQAPGIYDMLSGSFMVKKSDRGYVDAPMILRNESKWLTLSSGKLTASDFNEENIATVNFTIEPSKISSTFVREEIIIGEDIVEIIYRRLPPFVLRLNRDTYRYADRGTIEVINNTGVTMQIGVFCPENYIRFSARSFPVGARGEIPFEIKLSAFMNAQMLFRKLPYMQTMIEIKAKIPGQEFKKTLPITVGEW